MVPCVRSSLRIAFRAASSKVAQFSSVLVSPQAWFDVMPKSRIALVNESCLHDCVQELRPHLDGKLRLRLYRRDARAA